MPSVLTEVQLKEPVKKIQEYHISKVRKLLKECGDFGISNHPLSKRFKHGGMPVISPSIQVAPRTGPLAIF